MNGTKIFRLSLFVSTINLPLHLVGKVPAPMRKSVQCREGNCTISAEFFQQIQKILCYKKSASKPYK